jgi:hypothetical protein
VSYEEEDALLRISACPHKPAVGFHLRAALDLCVGATEAKRWIS